MALRKTSVVLAVLGVLHVAGGVRGEVVSSLNDTEGVRMTYGRAGAAADLAVVAGAGETVDGDGALRLTATSATADGNHYFGIMVPLPAPLDLGDVRLLFAAKTDHPEGTRAFYVRCYNRGEQGPALSFQSWDGQLKPAWRTFSVQAGLSMDGLRWEADRVEERVPTAVDRIEFIIGTGADETPVSLTVDELRTAPRLGTLADLEAVKPIQRFTPIAADGRAVAAVLVPDSTAGRAAGEAVSEAVRTAVGVALEVRVGTPADCIPQEPVILVGSVDTNPAMQLVYARKLTLADQVCPGGGGYIVHTVYDPFGHGANMIVVGASDDAGLVAGANVLCDMVSQQAEGASCRLGHTFSARYADTFLQHYPWADDPPRENRLAEGLADGERALATGRHRSIAGVLSSVATRY